MLGMYDFGVHNKEVKGNLVLTGFKNFFIAHLNNSNVFRV